MKYLQQNTGCMSRCTRWARRPHAKKLLSITLHTPYLAEIWNLMPRSFTFVCQLYCCSSKHDNNKALRITFNSCKTVSTSSMAPATVNIDKIIKVTSASSYVYRHNIFLVVQIVCLTYSSLNCSWLTRYILAYIISYRPIVLRWDLFDERFPSFTIITSLIYSAQITNNL